MQFTAFAEHAQSRGHSMTKIRIAWVNPFAMLIVKVRASIFHVFVFLCSLIYVSMRLSYTFLGFAAKLLLIGCGLI